MYLAQQKIRAGTFLVEILGRLGVLGGGTGHRATRVGHRNRGSAGLPCAPHSSLPHPCCSN